ncbi:hypothetical protein Pcinc_025564 [Petrolisthes cinctipes]|uniref:Uncharacterized protein n=1 Tax=Petrolisthes cinctipes TaxID=88211 RepID=A0AAE1KCV5_PETCI|nr:hypothetical protein Pcinc_025564 [Petrolisthes cinctipes]
MESDKEVVNKDEESKEEATLEDKKEEAMESDKEVVNKDEESKEEATLEDKKEEAMESDKEVVNKDEEDKSYSGNAVQDVPPENITSEPDVNQLLGATHPHSCCCVCCPNGTTQPGHPSPSNGNDKTN